LGSRLTKAISAMATSTVVDEAVLDEMLKEIGNALASADVSIPMVVKLRQNIKNKVKLSELAAGLDKRKIIKQAVFDELCSLLDPGKKPFKPQKGKPNVFMFVGLQGSGKTTTVTKLAYYYKKKGWKPCLICADTFRAGAVDQLRQNATKAKVPFYGSYTETDPVKVAQEGVDQFKLEGHDIIIVDTSGRHRQEEELFEEMEQIASGIKPDNIIFNMDSSIGQAAYDQALAFKQKVQIGSVIITKMDGHAKGGGAISAVAATESPIIFIGTGEHMTDLDAFEVKPFVSRLLGMGDWSGVWNMIEEVVPKDSQQELADRIQKGKFSLRDLYEQFQNILNAGPINKMMQMLPGFSNLPQLQGQDGNQKLKSFIYIMDSMTDKELDDAKVLNQSRIARIARGSGRSAKEVNELLTNYKHFEKMFTKINKMGGGNSNNMKNMSQVANMIPPHLLKQMGGFGGVQNMMKQLGNMDMGQGGKMKFK